MNIVKFLRTAFLKRTPPVIASESDQYEFIMELYYRKYNVGRNVNSDFFIATMRRVAIIFVELGVVKKFMQKF